MKDFLTSQGLLLDLYNFKHFLPGALWEGTGQNSPFHGPRCHHFLEQFQLTEKDRKFRWGRGGGGVKKSLAKI